MAGWKPFSSPGTGASAADRIALAEYQAGYGTPAEQRTEKKHRKRRADKRRKAKARAKAARQGMEALIIEEVPLYQDPRFIGGSLVFVAVVGGYWYNQGRGK